MTTQNKVTNQHQAHLSKLKNKRQQLENLLRSRERLDFEIKNLKKSISKDQKRIHKEAAILEKSNITFPEKFPGNITSSELPEDFLSIQESFGLEDDEDPQEIYRAVLAQKELLEEITDLLLKFGEPGN